MASDDRDVLLDTSFLIRLLNPVDPLHANARTYFRNFLDRGIVLHLSTISIAEYYVRGSVGELPLKNLRILPFNIHHGVVAGTFTRILFEHRNQLPVQPERLLIPNDAKLMAQAHSELAIGSWATTDRKSSNLYNLLKSRTTIDFQFVDISIPYHEYTGELNL